MASKVGRKCKTRANRNLGSFSFGLDLVDRVRFLTKYKSIWGEREIILSELDPSMWRNFESRNWVSLCEVFDPPPAALIREFYFNLSVYSEVTGGHCLTS